LGRLRNTDRLALLLQAEDGIEAAMAAAQIQVCIPTV
jgi:hypothetical protein